MGDVVAFPAPPASRETPPAFQAVRKLLLTLPLRARRAHFISAHHAHQALCWQEALNVELRNAGLPEDPVDPQVKHDLRRIIDVVADELMHTPAECREDLHFKRNMLAGLFDITWKPEWLEQLHRDEEAIGETA